MSLFTTIFIIAMHYAADFVFQTEEMAVNKSRSIQHLLEHTVTYSCYMTVGIIGHRWEVSFDVFIFFSVTLILHFITDYIMSRITSKKFKEEQYYTKLPNFGAFSIIGLDQLAHYIQLFVTYYVIFIYSRTI